MYNMESDFHLLMTHDIHPFLSHVKMYRGRLGGKESIFTLGFLRMNLLHFVWKPRRLVFC